MMIFGKTILAWKVWLTAIATLVAGFPYFECRCPGGQNKPFCPGTPSPTSCCCCHLEESAAIPSDKPCCRAKVNASVELAKEKPCCQNPGKLNPKSSTGTTCCSKTAQTHVFWLGSAKKTCSKDLTAGVFLPPQTTLGYSLPGTEHGRFPFWQIPPPTDLVTTLLRLLI